MALDKFLLMLRKAFESHSLVMIYQLFFRQCVMYTAFTPIYTDIL